MQKCEYRSFHPAPQNRLHAGSAPVLPARGADGPVEYNILYVRDAFLKKIPHACAPLRLHGEAVRADGKGIIVFLRIRPVPATGCRAHRLRQDERPNPACGHASSKLQGFVEFNREQRAGRHVNRFCDGYARVCAVSPFTTSVLSKKLTYRPAGEYYLFSVAIGADWRHQQMVAVHIGVGHLRNKGVLGEHGSGRTMECCAVMRA